MSKLFKLSYPRSSLINEKKKEIIVCNSAKNEIQIYDEEGKLRKRIGKEGKGRMEFNCNFSMTNNSRNELIIADIGNRRVEILNEDYEYLFEFDNIELSQRFRLVSNDFDEILISDSIKSDLKLFESDGKLKSKFGKVGNKMGEFDGPCGSCFDLYDNLLVTDYNNHRIQKFLFD